MERHPRFYVDIQLRQGFLYFDELAEVPPEIITPSIIDSGVFSVAPTIKM